MKIYVEQHPKVEGAWKQMKAFEKKVILANFREDHIKNENRRQYRNQLHAIEGALHTRLTPEFRILAERERTRLKSNL